MDRIKFAIVLQNLLDFKLFQVRPATRRGRMCGGGATRPPPRDRSVEELHGLTVGPRPKGEVSPILAISCIPKFFLYIFHYIWHILLSQAYYFCPLKDICVSIVYFLVAALFQVQLKCPLYYWHSCSIHQTLLFVCYQSWIYFLSSKNFNLYVFGSIWFSAFGKKKRIRAGLESL